MPAPIVIPVILIIKAAAALVGVVLVIVFFGPIKRMFTGKRVCILGEREVGKTMIARFLSTGEIHRSYKATVHTVTMKGKSLHLKDLKLELDEPIDHAAIDIKPITDVSGSEDEYNTWKEKFDNSDFVLYVFRSYLVTPSSLTDVLNGLDVKSNRGRTEYSLFAKHFNRSLARLNVNDKFPDHPQTDYSEWESHWEHYKDFHVSRIRGDIEQINNWIKGNSKPIILVGSFGDYIPGFNYITLEQKGEMHDGYMGYLSRKIPEITPKQRSNVLICSITTMDEMQYYVAKMFQLLQSYER